MCDWFEKGFFLKGGGGEWRLIPWSFCVVEEQARGEYLIMI